MRTTTILITAMVIAAIGLGVACGEDDSADTSTGSASPDFTGADLAALSFAADDVAKMEYQPQRSGPGAFTHGGENQQVAARLEELGLEANYSSQFFATSRDSELTFVESLVFLFEDEEAATAAVDQVKKEDLANLEPSEEIEAPELGEQAFGVLGDFDGYPVYSYGWRVGDVIQLLTVAPNGENPSPDSTLELAEQLVSQAQI